MSQPRPLWLNDGVHFAWIGADVVTLDMRSDVYGLMIDAAEAIRQGAGRKIIVDSAAACQALLQAGLVTATRPTSTTPLSVPSPKTALVPGETRGCALGPAVAAAVGALAATARFRRSSLYALAQRPSLPSLRRRPGVGLEEAYAAFDAALPWVPWEGQCLQRAFLLHRHLLQCGYAARWIIGVRTWPFLAHAWTQVGPCIVGDSLERVRTFQPILVV